MADTVTREQMRAGDPPEAQNTRSRCELLHDSDVLRNRSIVEIAAVNASVADYCRHWERRAEKAEAELAALKKRIAAAPQTNFELRQMGTPFAGINVAYSIPGWIGKRVRLLLVEDDDV